MKKLRQIIMSWAKNRQMLRLSFAAATIMVLVTMFAFTQSVANPAATPQTQQEHLQSQVDTATGAPRSGRDPAVQQQNDLAAAASKPAGAGVRVDNPAAEITDDHGDHHNHSSVDIFGDPQQTGIGSNGCFIDYGIQGQQCVPAHAATNGQLTCEGMRQHFPDGVKVSGTDRFHLDHNRDGTACGAGE